MRALCYGGTEVDERPIFQPIVLWVTVILSALLYEFRENRAVIYSIQRVCRCVRSFPLLYQIGGSDVLLFYSVWAVVTVAR